MVEHNDTAIMISSYYGMRERSLWIFKDYKHRGWYPFNVSNNAIANHVDYTLGYIKPHYPVPAIYNDPSNPQWWWYRIKFAVRYGR